MTPKELHETAEGLFSKRSSLMLLWQEQADNFYVERADFTYQRSLGTDFAANLMTSYPLMCRRELGDQIGQMLRPTAKKWAHVGLLDADRVDNEAKRWFQDKEGVMRRAMYDPKSLFVKAAKQGDHDYATFGQTVESVRLSRDRSRLLFQCWHLRDVVWKENAEGVISFIARRWKPTARDLETLFPGKVHGNVSQAMVANKPFEEYECMHFIVEADMYSGDARGKPYWSIYYDCANQHVMEAVPVWNKEYNIARWQTVSGSQYAFSPATVCALPDARLIQAMTYTLLEAGEKITNPPMVATQDVVRSDVAIYAGGITWVDRDYDERLGNALRPMTQDAKGMPLGVEMQHDSRAMIMQAFYLNKLNLPQRAAEMTAYEVGQRIQEYIRGALPIFEPMEQERNGGMCELVFGLMLRAGAFGSPQDMPDSLRGLGVDLDVSFHFESPLHDVIEQQKAHSFLESAQYIAAAVQLDPSTAVLLDAKQSLRDVLEVIIPAKWVRTEGQVQAIEDELAKQKAQQDRLAAMQQGSEVIGNLAGAAKSAADASATRAAIPV